MVRVPYQDGYICVSKDYYKRDNIRQPVTLDEAVTIAGLGGYVLPSPDMVDAIWKHADCKLKPIPMKPGPLMGSKEYIDAHDRMINDQLSGRECKLIAGHKKDIVAPLRQGRVTIYGWHHLNGKPIQPISSVHGKNYYDYSHGLRLVRKPE